MASGAYFRALTAAPLVAAAAPAVRVKLVFVDELAAFVHRQRGYASCWYLIPRAARLVGDLLHEIAHEFELLARCPAGLELQLEGFHVLANQEIEMIRDNDTLAVQCTTFVGDANEDEIKRSATKRTRDVHAQANLGDTRTSKKSKKQQVGTVGKKHEKAKATDGVKPAENRAIVDKKKPLVRRKSVLAALKVASDSSDSSSSNSSSSSDEGDDDDDEGVGLPNPKVKVSKEAFRAVVKDTVKRMTADAKVMLSSSSTSSSSESSTGSSDSDSSSEEDNVASTKVTVAEKTVNSTTSRDTNNSEIRTRRRRRPRRRPKSDGAAGMLNGVSVLKSGAQQIGTKGTQPKQTVPELKPQQQPQTAKEIRPLRIRGIHPSKTPSRKQHVRFDAPQVSIAEDKASRDVAPDLGKYRPQASNPPSKHRSRAQQKSFAPVETGLQQGSDDEPAMTQPVKEKWKRPYEIISSIHDEPADTTANDKLTLESRLASFPLKPSDATSVGLQTDDIVAYKTLKLCMATFQPVLTDWLCAQLVDVVHDAAMATVIPFEWNQPTTSTDMLAWKPARPHAGEDACIELNLNELSELRYLDGPTKAALDLSSKHARDQTE